MGDSLDFLVIGAQKAGTTAMFQYLRTHPAVFVPPAKEEPFFNLDYPATPYNSWTEYAAAVFAAAPPDAAWGKVTPQYMAGSLLGADSATALSDASGHERLIPARIRTLMPDVRLVALLRDPVDRAIAAHRMELALLAEARSFDEAISELLQPPQLLASRRAPRETNTYVVFGEYGRILQGYYDVFPSKQMLVVFTEELEREPETVMRRVFEHISVDAGFVPPNLGTRYFALGSPGRLPWLKPRLWEHTAARSRLLRAAWHRLPAHARTEFLERYWSWSHRMFVWNATTQGASREADGCSARTRQMLNEHYAHDLVHLRELIGRDLPWATSTSIQAA